jgi:hypothetical protein
MSHELSEKLTGLASRVNNLVVASTGDACRNLQQLEDQVTKYALVAIRLDLDEEEGSYKDALAKVNTSITDIDNVDAALAKIGDTISSIKNVVDAVGQVLTEAATVL